MKYLISLTFALTVFLSLSVSVRGQAATPTPSDTVTITRAQAVQCLTDRDTVKADAIEKAALLKAIDDLKKELSDIKITLAQYAGENMQLKSSAVRMDAIVDSFLRNQKARNKFGVIVF